MSRFFSEKYGSLTPYTPGEQPQDMQYVKLNTNESPYPPPPAVIEAAKEAAAKLQLYPAPDCKALTAALAARYGLSPDEALLTNGSDEILNFAFMAFCDPDHPIVFPDITYGFYPVFAKLNGVPYTEIPLKADLSIDPADYVGVHKNVVIANPNAPTGMALSLAEIERVAAGNPDNVVIVDEAYVDFGAESAVGLISRYDNLLVTQTFSKSRSMAGARLGMGFGCRSLIADLNTVKYATNPYNINRVTAAAGLAAIENDGYFTENCRRVAKTREETKKALEALGFTVLPSKSNFLFAKTDRISGEALYRELKARGVLIRHFTQERIRDYNRITIGSPEQMRILLDTVRAILEETA